MFRDEVTATTIEEQIGKLMGHGDSGNKSLSKESQTSNGVLIRELGHILGMLHDTRDPRNIMVRGYDGLGKMFDPKTAAERPVRFSLAHARMAETTWFFSESFDERDSEPPWIEEFQMASPARAGQKDGRVLLGNE